LARQRARADRLNPLDEVTSLLNRQHFFELAERDFRRSWRFGHPIAALVIDVDDFAKLHLQLGPKESDEVIRAVAQTCHSALRNVDLIGRLATDKLGVLLVMIKREDVIKVAERLRRAVAKLETTTPDGPWQITVSIGATAYPRDNCASVNDLFILAEQSTRAAKRAGRNRVVGI
jgi:diguanylate cyclase (GGDEF)-like protein